MSLVLGLVTGGADVANAFLLSNGDLNLASISSQNLPTPTGWTVDASRTISGAFFDGASSEGFANFNVVDPAVGALGLFFKPFSGNAEDGNLTVHFYQDNPATPGVTYTLTAYAGAEANYSGLMTTNDTTKSVLAVEFLDGGGAVIGGSTNDLKAAGLGSSGESFGYAEYTAMATAPALTVSVRARVSMIDAFGNPAGGGQAFVCDYLTLTSPGSAVITNQPGHQSVSLGETAVFTVGVSNTAGVTYQWQHDETNLVDGGNISGATSDTLTITEVSVADVGHYRVLVTNPAGTIPSTDGSLAIVGIGFYPTVTIDGKVGDTYRVDYATSLDPATWIPLSTNILTSPRELVVDSSSPNSNKRFYRAVHQP